MGIATRHGSDMNGDGNRSASWTAAVKVSTAVEADAPAIAALRNAAADHLTATYGRGHWSGQTTDGGVAGTISKSRVLVARLRRRIVGTLTLVTKKPWAIDVAYFTPVNRALYLIEMAVLPEAQRAGVGRQLLERAAGIAREWPAQAIRLDAYDAPAGAGGFYEKCGYRETGRVVYRTVPLVYFERLL